jgi:phosphatidylglycerophosphatase A
MTNSENPSTSGKSWSAVDRSAVGVAPAGGTGYVPRMPGTIGSLGGVLIYLVIVALSLEALYIPILAALVLAGIWAAGHVETIYGHDASRITIDEVVGQLVTLGFVARSGAWAVGGAAILGFLIFRFFDILKPFPIRRLEQLPGGIGVVADDVGAGVYALLVLVLTESLAGKYL